MHYYLKIYNKMRIVNRLNDINKKNGGLLSDSIWAVSGNGIGNFLLLVAGIVIARLLGKDLYGEYGMVKTTMFNIAAFSTFGLGYTATKFVSEYFQKDKECIKGIVKTSLYITLISSSSLCILLFLFAQPLAVFINAPELATPFRFLGIIMICRAMATTSGAICSGFKDFKNVGINNVLSGFLFFLFGFILTYYGSVNGALIALFLSQLVMCITNLVLVNKHVRTLPPTQKAIDTNIFKYSFPVALQELSYMISTWGATLLITKYASLGEVGIWTAAQQWNAIVLFIPGLLVNVVLAYLSGSIDTKQHKGLLKKMLFINFICAALPLLIVVVLSPFIVSMYGASFEGMGIVLNTLLIGTLLMCLSSVLQSDFISIGKNWELLLARFIRDTVLIVALYVIIRINNENAALKVAIINVVAYFIYFIILLLLLKRVYKSSNK